MEKITIIQTLIIGLTLMSDISLINGQEDRYREPRKAIPGQEPSDYVPNGEYHKIDDLDLYVARPGKTGGNGEKFVVWGHDIFGWKSGRTQELVDRLAADTEYTVILPNLFRGKSWPPPEVFDWDGEIKVM